MFPFNPSANGFRLDDLERVAEDAEQVRRRAEVARRELEDITGEGESANGRVRAFTGATGRLLEIRLDPRVMEMGSQDLAEEVTLAVRRAQEDGDYKRERMLRDVLGSSALSTEELVDPFQEISSAFSRSLDEREARVREAAREVR
ncbi:MULTISPECIES: YbaB/EbfC family nucleoid-associated protein [unclassified Streptosporangium]|uniref:YbaB/EbfC family nucleoid-associated protein n=1 Tax=unclassified Streptosporangium TaxID=2632669 RepID=UPI002E2A6206|nr:MULTISPECIES: YbaB/EbfC family nucleoid-associated protein [unclassified Streptosporangium]